MRKYLLIATLLVAVLGGTFTPSFSGSASAATRTQTHHIQAHPALFDKTRFVLHLGFAYFAFHHWVWKPYRAGSFNKGAAHRTKDLIKGGLALLFTVHEVKVAYGIAKGSNSKTLKLVIKPVSALISAFTKVGNQLKSGVVSGGDLTGMNKLVDSIGGSVGGVKDRTIPIPGI